MTATRRIFRLSILLFFAARAHAQVLPVTQLCVSQDTLYWSAPANTCGSFISFEVYGSMSAGGPFSLLGTVTDESQSFFFHATAGNDTWYYYVLSYYNCPGSPAVSDTVNNEPPGIAPISSVSVEGDDVVVTWQASASPEVIGYIVYRETAIGVVPIDTVFGTLTFTDTTASPDTRTETYFVNALDACGNTSIFDQPHQTMLLQASADSCTRAIMLSWNPYDAWPEGIERQEVWVSQNGDVPVLAASLSPEADSWVFEDAQQGITYCFFIQAFAKNNPWTARSSERCVAPDVVQPQAWLLLSNVQTNADGTREVVWQWDTNGEIQSYSLVRATDSTFQDGSSLFVEPAPPFLSPSVLWADTLAVEGLYYYRIETTDACGAVRHSNAGRNLLLTGEPLPGQRNLLEWTEFFIEGATLQGYDLYRIVDGQESLLASYGSLFTSHFDQLDPAVPAQANACYYVVARASLALPDGTVVPIEQRSNTVCLTQPATIYLPNALAPRGYNKEFKPVFVFGQVSDYELLIFDRYGQLIFESRNPDTGWTGITAEGRLWPAGAYTYLLRFTQPTGEQDERRGVVLLIH